MADNSNHFITLDDVEDYVAREVNKRFSFNKFDIWYKTELSGISSKAGNDGEKNIPAQAATGPQNNELYIENTFKAKLIELLNPGLLILNQVNDGPIKSLDERINKNPEKERDIQIEEEKTRTLVSLEQGRFEAEKKKIGEELEKLENQKNDIQKKFSAKISETGKEKPKHWNEYFCWAIIILLAFVEIPINSKVFEFFKLNRVETYITSGILIFAYPILSHFSGIALHKNSTGKPNYKAAVPVFVFIILLCLFINLFRVDYIGQSGNEFGAEVSMGVGRILSTTSFWMAFLINLAIFICAIIMSYHMHDPDFEFETAYKNYKKQLPKIQGEIEQLQFDMAGAEKVHNQKLSKFETDRAESLKKIEAEAQKKKNEYNNYMAAHDTALQYLQNLQDYINEKYHAAIRHYRSQNSFYRKQDAPSYWSDPIADLPDLIAERGFEELNAADDADSRGGKFYYN